MKKYIIYLLILVSGVLVGKYILGGGSGNHEHIHEQAESNEVEIYTCSMHPQIQNQGPGLCPICAMDLVPLDMDESSNDPYVLKMSDQAIELASLSMSPVVMKQATPELQFQGKIQINSQKMFRQSNHFEGRIESLKVTFDGEYVKQGDLIATIYSPKLINAQNELLEVLKYSHSDKALIASAKRKLKNLKVSNREIEKLVASGLVKNEFPVYATRSGYVHKINIQEGDYVKRGQMLLELMNTDNVWAEFEIHEKDIAKIEKGNIVSVKIPSLPNLIFESEIFQIDPLMDHKSRIVKARAELDNSNGSLKPDMSLIATLVEFNGNESLFVPATAVMWTGKRSLVYVNEEPGVFRMKEVKLGDKTGSEYEILDGLEEGEMVVSNGAFTLDAAAQLSNKFSMMNQPGGRPDGTILTEAEMWVNGNCTMCKSTIEEAVLSISGVRFALWSVDDKILQLRYDEETTSLDQIQRKTAEVGYDNHHYTAKKEVYENLHACCKYDRSAIPENESTFTEDEVWVNGNCTMCKTTIEDAVSELEGVSAVNWSTESKMLKVKYSESKTSLDEILKTTASAGYDNDFFKAGDEVYNNLHSCCKYERK